MDTLIQILIVIFIFVVIKELHRWEYPEHFAICGQKKLNRIEIWENVLRKYGERQALNIFPKTFIFPRDLMKLKNDKNNQFILKKKWSLMRIGVDLYDNKQDILRDYRKYDLAQVYIKNPLLINGFKFDIRIFFVTYCGIGNYLYSKAYNVYTKKKFDYNTLDREKKINQVHTQDIHYTINKLPRTTDQLGKYLNINFRDIMIVIRNKLRIIINACNNLCCLHDHNDYNIYGIDATLLNNLEPLIIEINSSPSLHFTENWKKKLLSNLKSDVKEKKFLTNKTDWIKI